MAFVKLGERSELDLDDASFWSQRFDQRVMAGLKRLAQPVPPCQR